MKTITLFCALFFCLAFFAPAQSTIAYFSGPPFAISDALGNLSVDMNQDGLPDFSFAGGAYNCTADIPISGCSSIYSIASLNTNQVICQNINQVIVLPYGASISDATSSNATWRVTPGATLATVYFSPRFGTSGWDGPLATLPEGYLGIRFYANDGIHYGWIHVTLTNSAAISLLPVIHDWAYETRPNVPILAGALPIVAASAPQVIRPQNFRLNWPSQIGRPYRVQFKEQLDQTLWTSLELTIVATATNSAVDVPILGATRFFRIVQPQ